MRKFQIYPWLKNFACVVATSGCFVACFEEETSLVQSSSNEEPSLNEESSSEPMLAPSSAIASIALSGAQALSISRDGVHSRLMVTSEDGSVRAAEMFDADGNRVDTSAAPAEIILVSSHWLFLIYAEAAGDDESNVDRADFTLLLVNRLSGDTYVLEQRQERVDAPSDSSLNEFARSAYLESFSWEQGYWDDVFYRYTHDRRLWLSTEDIHSSLETFYEDGQHNLYYLSGQKQVIKIDTQDSSHVYRVALTPEEVNIPEFVVSMEGLVWAKPYMVLPNGEAFLVHDQQRYASLEHPQGTEDYGHVWRMPSGHLYTQLPVPSLESNSCEVGTYRWELAEDARISLVDTEEAWPQYCARVFGYRNDFGASAQEDHCDAQTDLGLGHHFTDFCRRIEWGEKTYSKQGRHLYRHHDDAPFEHIDLGERWDTALYTEIFATGLVSINMVQDALIPEGSIVHIESWSPSDDSPQVILDESEQFIMMHGGFDTEACALDGACRMTRAGYMVLEDSLYIRVYDLENLEEKVLRIKVGHERATVEVIEFSPEREVLVKL